MVRGFDHFTKNEREQLRAAIDHYSDGLLSCDPPAGTRLRGLIGLVFTPRVIVGLAPFIRQIADESLDALGGASDLDLIEDFAYPLPARVLHRLSGPRRRSRPGSRLGRPDHIGHWFESCLA